MPKTYLSVGDLSRRSGLPISTLHFYERKRLISSERNGANHRVYRRDILRRVTVIKVAQRTGIPLAQISAALSRLPEGGVPNAKEWAQLSEVWHDDLTERIDMLTALRDDLADCIGCGCLSVKNCPLVNSNDHLAAEGPGPRRW